MRTKKQREAIVEEALKRFDVAKDAWREIYELAVEDIRFVDEDGAQWDDAAKLARHKRPSMTFDKLSQAVDQTVGDHLQNKPGIKIRGAEDDDADVAEIYEGLIRQIESRGGRAYKTGFKFAAKGGFGAWMLDHDYVSDMSMDQDIILRELKNPFSVLVDPVVQVSRVKDMQWGFLFTDMPRAEFEAKWPKAQSTLSESYKAIGSQQVGWISEDEVRVADYFRLTPVSKVICQLSTGEVVDKDEFAPIADEMAAQGVTVERERKVSAKKLERFKVTALEVLEEVECIGQRIPIVPIFGKQSNINGKMVTRGLVRKGKDPQRLYNYERSNYIETVALAPKQQIMATPKMIKGHEARWRDMNTSSDPVLLFNFDEGQMPQRVGLSQVPTALVTGLQMSADDIKSATGIYDAGLGARSNETSGRAIRARQLEGDTATYEFTDELVDAMTYTGEIMCEWIPLVYDATRQIRILGEDDAEEVVAINKPTIDLQTGEEITLNDLSRGKYDVKVTVGASYSTRRVETAEQLAQVMQGNPELGQIIADQYFKSLDLVGADEVIERVRKMGIQRGYIEPTDAEKQEMAEKSQQNRDPSQEMQQQAQMRLLAANVAEAEAKVGEIQSRIQMNQAKAREGAPTTDPMDVAEFELKRDLELAELELKKREQDRRDAEFRFSVEKEARDIERERAEGARSLVLRMVDGELVV